MASARGAAWLVGVGCLAVVWLAAVPAAADQNPPGCTQNNLVLDIGRDKTVLRNGDTITYVISAANVDSPQGPACNLTATTFTFIAPAADGTPSGARTVLRSNVDFPAGTARTVLGNVAYKVAVNPGVTDTVAEAQATGILHDAPNNDTANVVKTLGSTVTQPHTSLAASVSLTAAVPPLTAVYTYTETNDASVPAPLAAITITDDSCSPVTLVSGTATPGKYLANGQSWIYTCSRQITKPGTYISHITGTGVNLADGLAAPLEATQVSVTVLGAKALPLTVPKKFPAIPVTGPTVPVAPLGALAVAFIGLGAVFQRRRHRQGMPWP